MAFRDLSQLDPLFLLRLLLQRDGPAQQVAESAVASALDNPVVRDALRYASYADVPFDAVRVQLAPLVEDLRYGLSGYPSLEGTDQLTRQAADVRGFWVRAADQFASGQPYEPLTSFGLVGDMVLDPTNWVVPGAGAVVRAGRALGLADETAEHLAHALGIRRIADQTMETVEPLARRAEGILPSATRALPLEELVADAKAGGFTIDPRTGARPSRGFAFSEHPEIETIIPVSEFSEQHLADFINRNAHLLENPEYFIGAWRDGDNIYLDISTIVDDLDEALRRGYAAKQFAVFDLGNSRSISTGYRR